MAGCCGCCAALRPRYKRLVDNIYPADPHEGLVKSNMDKLTFFAMKSPEKLDRIGDYLAQRLSRDVSRGRHGLVMIAMEAFDSLLVTCHAQALNLLVISYLRMVQKLLEYNDPELQCLATTSFVKFSNIEEDTPCYHRSYDFFVSKFSSLCHSNNDNSTTRKKLRVSGLQGLQGLVRKTISDDLQVNIWDRTHMDKIVPSLLLNMHEYGISSSDQSEVHKDEENPSTVAENVFRDLVCRASYSNISAVLKPVLTHLDNHNLWVSNKFAVNCLRIIMYSVQAQYGYAVVQMLMTHLDENSKKNAKIKACHVDVLSETVLIAAEGSIGPSVLDVFNTLLRHLRQSVNADIDNEEQKTDEVRFQEAIINTIGEFANNLPDYQKIEIMIFVMGKVPIATDDKSNAKVVLLQTMLMKTLLKVATKYKTVLMTNAFPQAFLEPLLRMSLNKDAGIRRIVEEIIHTLLDRHDNAAKFKTVRIPKDIAQLDLTVEKALRQDILFMKKNGSLIYWHLYENVQMDNNHVDNFESLYCTMCLLCIEMGGDEVLMELLNLALGIQQMTMTSDLPMTHKCAIHASIAAFLNLISQLTAIPSLCQHVTQVIEARQIEAPYYLPTMAFNRNNTAKSSGEEDWGVESDRYPALESTPDHCMFSQDLLSEALTNSGHDTSRLTTPFIVKPSGLDSVDLSKSSSDIHSVSLEMDSAASTPSSSRKSPHEEITFESLKKVLLNDPKVREEEEKEQKKIYESFKSGAYEDIVARSEAKSQEFQDKLDEILDMIAEPQESPGGTPRKSRIEEESIPIYEMQFPELFVY